MKFKFLSKIALLSILFVGCQSEENQVIQESPDNITSASPLTTLMGRVTQNPTSNDNIIDNTSCFSVVLPVTVIVNGQNIEVNTQEDYQIVQNAINEFTDDDDIVNFVYPISVQFQNFSTQVLEDEDDLEDVIEDCGEDNDFDEIDCISFEFPLTINLYNANNQVPETIIIQNNIEFYNFLENLEDSDLIQIQYPITINDPNGNPIVINNNNQLEDAIENLIDDCNDDSDDDDDDDDDDNDDDDNPSGSNEAFNSTITEGTWSVSYFYDNGDETSNYAGYVFNFNSNGTITATLNSNTITGTWLSYIDDNEDKFELSFQGQTLEELEEDWEVVEFSANEIRLKDDNDDNDGNDYLYLTKN
jgi:hypothetical protein